MRAVNLSVWLGLKENIWIDWKGLPFNKKLYNRLPRTASPIVFSTSSFTGIIYDETFNEKIFDRVWLV